MAPIDPNWKKPTVSPEMVTLVKDINLSDRELDRWYDKDRFLYNNDVLVPEAKLNELAKEHPEVWKPMIFECNGYRSICVSENGYIISAYQPAPNVFLPIHIYGVSDHRGPTGYDAEKSIIITVNKFHDDPDHKEKLYEADDRGDEVTEAEVHKAYERMI